MKGKYVITGASGSMGSAAVRALAAAGHPVVMACRNIEKGESVRRKILEDFPSANLSLMHLDLASLDSVRGFAEDVSSQSFLLDGLFNNAGVISREYDVTEDGYENTLQVNYIAPYLLTRLLLPRFSEGARIVNMVSLTCRFGNVGRDLFERGEDRFSRLKTYFDAKLAFLLFSIALKNHCRPDIVVNVADPGIVDSNMITMGKWFDPLADALFRPFCNSPEKGVSPALSALCAEDSLGYYVGERRKPISQKYAVHPLLNWLWDETATRLSL